MLDSPRQNLARPAPGVGAGGIYDPCVIAPFSGRCRPDEIRAQPFANGAAIIRPGNAGGRVIKGMIGCRQALGIVAHQVGHNNPDTPLLVIQHDGRAAVCAGAKFERAIRVLIVKRLAIKSVRIVHGEICVVKKDNMRCRLPGHSFADGAVACVIVYRFVISVRVDMVAPSSVLV